jgi:amino acid adenylation domain-containing protein
MGAEQITYAELEHRANQLARVLIERGLRRGDRACLLQPKSPAAIISMLAILKAGAMYVPLDVASPATRLLAIIAAAEPRFVLASAPTSHLARALDVDCEFGTVEGRLQGAVFGPDEIRRASGDPLAARSSPQDAAHLLFTSGSTGTPKGVVITHAMVSAFLKWALSYFGHKPGDRVSGHPPLHFDLSTFDIYGTLASGGELHLAPPDLLTPDDLAQYIRDAALTQWFSVPSTFTYMMRGEAVRHGDFESLERIIWCGEVLPPTVLAHWMSRVPAATYTNLYGPTETTIASTFHRVAHLPSDLDAPIPIGTPCGGESVSVLGDELRRVGTDEIGELCIDGDGVSPGYWRDPEKTKEVFVVEPLSGRRLYRTGDLGRCDSAGILHYVGRTDSQIKSRGYRIELGEIETALSTVHGIGECAVVGVASNGFEGTAICCAWAPLGDAELDVAKLRRALAKRVPAYMLPSKWQRFEELPKNVSEKVDRRWLKEMFHEDSR